MRFQIISDSACDLPRERVQELSVEIVPFYVSFEEENYMKEGVDVGVEEFYRMMADRAGEFPKTSMPSVQDYADVFERYAKENVPVLCICINAAFSGSIQSAMNARTQILEEYPDAQIEVMDSELVTLLQGMLVEEACRLRGAPGGQAEGALGTDVQCLCRGEIGSPRHAGQVDDQRPRGQAGKLGPAQHRCGNGVDHRVKPGQNLGQPGQVDGTAARAPGPGTLLRRAGRYRNHRSQHLQPPCHRTPHPAISQHQNGTLPDGALPQLHEQADAALRGGDGVEAGQFRPLEIIDQFNARRIGRCLHRRTDLSAQRQRARPRGPQYAGQIRLARIQRHGQKDIIGIAHTFGACHGVSGALQGPGSRALARVGPHNAEYFLHVLTPGIYPMLCRGPASGAGRQTQKTGRSPPV